MRMRVNTRMSALQKLKWIFLSLFFISAVSCTTKKVMEDDHAKFKDINDEFKMVVKVDDIKEPIKTKTPKATETSIETSDTSTRVIETPAATTVVTSPQDPKKSIAKKEVKAESVKPPVSTKKSKILVREPKIEDSENFNGRRPLIDPFAQNEKITLSVNYFNVEAGEVIMSVLPFKKVNDRKAYHYSINVRTNRMFARFYAVDNTAETYVDYETLLPLTFSINVKESSRLKEVRMYFDRVANMATYWEKTVKKNEEEKKKKKEWEIEHYAQNVISAIYYLRNFTLYKGKKLAFYVADDGKNLTFHGEVLREEKLQTAVGELDTTVVKINFEMDDQFKQTGDNFIWLTKDEHRHIVRIESKVKIGTLVAKLKSIQKGAP